MSSEALIEVHGAIDVHAREFRFRLIYPVAFPSTPPFIKPMDPSERWTAHQYGPGGSLCLQWRAENWDPRVHAADILTSAYDLLRTENDPIAPGQVLSDHSRTVAQTQRQAVLRAVLTPALRSLAESLRPAESRSLEARKCFHSKAQIIVVTTAPGADDTQVLLSDIPRGLQESMMLFALPYRGIVLKCQTFDRLPNPLTRASLGTVLEESGFPRDILFDSGDQDQLKPTIAIFSAAGSTNLWAVEIRGPIQTPVLTEAKVLVNSSGRRLVQTTNISAKRVGIVGAGSIGSKVAVSLARSGVRDFVLVDEDQLAIGNLVRHELNWAQLGQDKVFGLEEELYLTASNMSVAAYSHTIGGQESAFIAADVLSELISCDVVIDATANADVFVRLAGACLDARVPMLWGELFAGGYGGLVARARPGKDPNPYAVRAAVLDFMSRQPEAPFKVTGGYDGFEAAPLIAHDSEVGQVAMTLARMTIDVLEDAEVSCYESSAYLLGFRELWIFSQAFDTIPIDAAGPGWDSAAESLDAGDARRQVERALRQMVDV